MKKIKIREYCGRECGKHTTCGRYKIGEKELVQGYCEHYIAKHLVSKTHDK